jgi:ParB/RepB/Spo0J family partition protein
MPKYELIPIEQLIEPEIPARGEMDEGKLADLCESVKEIGYIQPLAVVLVSTTQGSAEGPGRSGAKGKAVHAPVRYEIADGHRRYMVGKMLSHKTLPCLIFDNPENAREAIKLHSALFREDLSTAEEAAFVADLIGKYDYTEEQLCRVLRQRPTWINERLALLRGNTEVFEALQRRTINLAVAKQLNRIKDAAQCKYFLSLVVEGGATALTVGKWVTEFLTKGTVQASTVQPGQAKPELEPVAPTGPVCFFCRKEANVYDLENVWIHPWEKKMIEAQIDRAAPVPQEGAGADGSPN